MQLEYQLADCVPPEIWVRSVQSALELQFTAKSSNCHGVHSFRPSLTRSAHTTFHSPLLGLRVLNKVPNRARRHRRQKNVGLQTTPYRARRRAGGTNKGHEILTVSLRQEYTAASGFQMRVLRSPNFILTSQNCLYLPISYRKAAKPIQRTVNQTIWNWNLLEPGAQMELVEADLDGTGTGGTRS